MKAEKIYFHVIIVIILILCGCSINQKQKSSAKLKKIHFVTETKSIAETQLTIIISKLNFSPDTIFIPSDEVVNLEIKNKDSKSYKIIAGNIFSLQKDNFNNNLFSKTSIDINLNNKGKNNFKIRDEIRNDFQKEGCLLIPADKDISFTFSIPESKIGEWQIAIKSIHNKNPEWLFKGTIIVN